MTEPIDIRAWLTANPDAPERLRKILEDELARERPEPDFAAIISALRNESIYKPGRLPGAADAIEFLVDRVQKQDVLISQLASCAERGLRDSMRVDYLAAHPRLSQIYVDGKVEDCYFYGAAGASGWTLRQVIDAAAEAESNRRPT